MKIVFAGAGRFSRQYINMFLNENHPDIELAGIVENNLDASPMKAEILASGVPVYSSIEEFYANDTADLAVLCTPPFVHKQQSIYSVQHGSNVMSEKPAAPTEADTLEMIEAEKKYGKFIAIGYQWSFTDTMQKLKKDILSGKLGKPLYMKTHISWPRNFVYYGGSWSGKLFKNGVPVYDSIAFNGCAHFIHNMFFLLGDKMNESAYPDSIEAECLRANDIESYDTCVLRMKVKDTKLYFIASHAAKDNLDPQFEYVFENATVTFNANNRPIGVIAKFNNGETVDYGYPHDDTYKVLVCVDAVKNNTKPVCTALTALPHVKLIEYLYHNVPIKNFSKDLIVNTGDRIYVDGLYEKMLEAYDSMSMLSEVGYKFRNKKALCK